MGRWLSLPSTRQHWSWQQIAYSMLPVNCLMVATYYFLPSIHQATLEKAICCQLQSLPSRWKALERMHECIDINVYNIHSVLYAEDQCT